MLLVRVLEHSKRPLYFQRLGTMRRSCPKRLCETSRVAKSPAPGNTPTEAISSTENTCSSDDPARHHILKKLLHAIDPNVR